MNRDLKLACLILEKYWYGNNCSIVEKKQTLAWIVYREPFLQSFGVIPKWKPRALKAGWSWQEICSILMVLCSENIYNWSSEILKKRDIGNIFL